MSEVFERFHPAVLFAYFMGMAVLSMLLFHPLFIALGFAAAVTVGLLCAGGRAVGRACLFGLPLAALAAVFNPLVNVGGETVLFTWLGRPFTLQALAYGCCAGVLLLSVCVWFVSYNTAVPPEKSLYLFSFAAPGAAMLATMSQRMVPLFLRRASAVRDAQRMLGRPSAASGTSAAGGMAAAGRMSAASVIPAENKTSAASRPSAPSRSSVAGRPSAAGNKNLVRGAVRELSALLTWSMEEGLDTADSMKARGYGVGRRSFYAAYRFNVRDGLALALVGALLFLCVFCVMGGVRFDFYPRFDSAAFGRAGVVAVCAYAALAALPFAARGWRKLWR